MVFVRESPIKMDDWGYSYFQETTILRNLRHFHFNPMVQLVNVLGIIWDFLMEMTLYKSYNVMVLYVTKTIFDVQIRKYE